MTIYASMEHSRTLTPPTVPSLWYPSFCPFASPSFIHSAPLFSSHAHTTSTYFSILSFGFRPLLLSPIFFHLLSVSFVTRHIHRSIRIPATSNLFSCAFSNTQVSTPYSSAGLTTILNPFPLIFMFADTLFQFSTLSAHCGWLLQPGLHHPPNFSQIKP